MENIIKCSHPKMTNQTDQQDESLTGQAHDRAGHCPLTGCYFEPWKLKSLLCCSKHFISDNEAAKKRFNVARTYLYVHWYVFALHFLRGTS